MISEAGCMKTHVAYKFLIFIGIMLISSNSSQAVESICPGGSSPNSNVLFCEDFDDGNMRDGKPNNWDVGNFHPNGIAAAITCSGSPGGTGYGGSGCSFWSDYLNQAEGSQLDGQFAWGEYKFSESEVYVRYYFKKSAGKCASWAQKGLVVGGDVGAQISSDFICSEQFSVHSYDLEVGTGVEFLEQNQGSNNLKVQAGKWYLVEVHVKLNTPGQKNGIAELWMDDVSGGTPASQTLRLRYTNLNWAANSGSRFRRINLFTNFQNSATAPLYQYVWYDQIVVSKARIGPMGRPASDDRVPKSPQIISIQ